LTGKQTYTLPSGLNSVIGPTFDNETLCKHLLLESERNNCTE